MAALLEACLHLTESQARDQWNAIRRRAWQPRQEPFLPVETLVSYGLFFLLDPHRFGGGNIDRVPPEVKVLAATFKRSFGSLMNKMLNLDGSRKNSARDDPELFIRLQEPGHFERLYRRVLKAARGDGLSEAEVPDFMAALHEDDAADLLGQEELGSSEVAVALRELFQEERDFGSHFGFSETETSRLIEQRVRLAQHRFARGVLANYGWTCGSVGSPRDRCVGTAS